MPRKPRIEYAGAIYHVMSRGNRGLSIFEDDTDREVFLETLGQVCKRCGWVIHSYVLMSNHFHILLETPEANLVAGMRWFQSTYTQRYNRRHRVNGHLFQGRYKAILVDPESRYYFEVVSTYIHLNPARAKIFDLTKEKLNSYKWSSFPCYTRPSKRPEWLSVQLVLEFFNRSDTPSGRAYYRNYMNKRVDKLSKGYKDPDWSDVRRGWCLGDHFFRERMIERVEKLLYGKRRESHSGEIVVLHNEKQAFALKEQSLGRLGLTDSDLQNQRKGSVEKKLLIWYIHKHTMISNRWLSTHLYCGHSSNIPHYVSEINKTVDSEIMKLKKILKSED